MSGVTTLHRPFEVASAPLAIVLQAFSNMPTRLAGKISHDDVF
jgi:hypothetical protein